MAVPCKSIMCCPPHWCSHCGALDGAQGRKQNSQGPDYLSQLLGWTCALQGGLNCAAVAALHKAHITCKDSLLVGWGGGTDQDKDSCPVAVTWHEGTRLDLDR
jgi:hypothetical protein